MTDTKESITLTGETLDKYNLVVGKLGEPGCLEEVLDDDKLRKKMATGQSLKVYWGTAPTGIPTIGYLCPMKKIADMLRIGWHVTILFADLHAFLDGMKSPLELVKLRTKVYEEIIKTSLLTLGADINNIKFVVGSDFQLKSDYQMDLFRLGNITTVHTAQKAGTEVVKQNNNPLVTSLLYPLMQALDEQYLGVDIFFGGMDQRKINILAMDVLPKIGYEKRIHLMNPIISSLSPIETKGVKTKMSSSNKDGKITLLDSGKEIQKKISKAYCKEGDIVDNTPLLLVKELLFPILIDLKKQFIINRPEKYGGTIKFEDFKTLESAFLDKKIYPVDLKLGITDLLIQLTEPIRKKFETNDMQELLMLAYPIS